MSELLRAGWIVYFNGIQIPAIACSISSGVWQIPQASISVPADRIMQRVGADDRVRCTIFAIDPYRSENNPSEPDQFRLAFDGEIINFSYQTTSSTRAINFVAVDLIEALTRIFPHFVTSLESIAKGQAGTDQAANSAVVNPMAPLQGLLTAGLTGSGKIKRPYDFVDNILRWLLDDTVLTNERSVVITEWFKPWNQRTGFSDRFVPSAYVEEVADTGEVPAFPIFRAAQNSAGIDALADSASQLGMGGPMYRIIQNVFQHVYYELAMIPNPPVLAVNKETRVVVGGAGDATAEPAPVDQELRNSTASKLAELEVQLEQELGRLNEIAGLQAGNEAAQAAFKDQQKLVAALQADVAEFKLQSGDYSAYQQPVIEADKAMKEAQQQLARQKEVVARNSTAGTRDALEKIEARVTQLEEEKKQAVEKAKYLTNNAQGSELVIAQYMTKPQVLFGVAPSFNVLWPSMYEQFSYEENFALQPTRTYLGDPHIYNLQNKGGQSAGKTALDARQLTVGYPPEANLRLAEKQGGSKINVHNFLIKYEEYFKGPVYNQLVTPEWFQALAKRGDGDDSANLQRLYVRYEHERMRASRRNGAVVGPYNPNAVAGFPGVVIDNEESNNHVFGYFTQVSHSFTQTSMSTNISFTHAQTFGEFFSTLSDQYFEDSVTSITEDTPLSVPQHPFRELRDRFQVNNAAREYYQTMFWGSPDITTPDAVIFDLFNVVAIRNADGTISNMGFEVEEGSQDVSFRSSVAVEADIVTAKTEIENAEAAVARESEAGLNSAGVRNRYETAVERLSQLEAELAESKKLEAENEQREGRGSSGQPILTGTPNPRTAEPPEYVIKGAYAQLMKDSKKAFAYGSRPICTLEQYIDLKGESGVREGYRGTGNKQEGQGAPYYVKIFELVNDPVLPVDLSADGLPCGPVGTDVRRNWEQRLLAFRQKVYTSKNPFKA